MTIKDVPEHINVLCAPINSFQPYLTTNQIENPLKTEIRGRSQRLFGMKSIDGKFCEMD